MSEDEGKRRLTTRQGHPVADNQHQRTVGDRGPATLENYHFLEKISHFDRERIPERVVHARGFVAHGVFEAYGTIGGEPASKYTRAALFQEKGKRTPVIVRFSTVIGGRDSPETARDPRGFAVKFKTEAGNWDLVGNNLPVFFIRDAIKFPDVIHALKPDPVTFRQEPKRIFDFMSLTPEAMHMLTWLFSPRGIPKSYRHMDGFGVNTYKLVNAAGEAVLVKYHWKTRAGDRVAHRRRRPNAIQAIELGHATKDLYEAIERARLPEWELIRPDHERRRASRARLGPARRHEDLAGRCVPAAAGRQDDARTGTSLNAFAENEQVAFGTGVLVDGLEFSDDKMLVGRTFSYSDTQRYRVGPNYLQLPVNAPRTRPATNQRDGQMSHYVDDGGVEPARQLRAELDRRPPRSGRTWQGL